MVDPLATPDIVRTEIDTFLGNEQINDLIDRTARDIYRAYVEADFDDADHRRDFEALMTALRIATRFDRAESGASTGRTSVEYEASLIADLRGKAAALEPGDALVSGTVIRDTDRHVRSVTPGSDDGD